MKNRISIRNHETSFFYSIKIQTGIDTTKFQTYTDDEHILARPDMYLGSSELQANSHISYTPQQGIFYSNKVYQVSTQQLFLEIIENSVDNFQLSGYPQNYFIQVNMNPREFSVKNNGRIFNLSNDQRVLQSINNAVSVPKTSSHFGEDNIKQAGMNGYGAKLVCITQKLFEIQVCNNNLKFTSIWYNMKQNHQQQLVPWNQEQSFQVHVQLTDKGYQRIIQGKMKQFYFEDLDIPQCQFYLQHLPFLGIKNIYFNGQMIQPKTIQQLYNPESMCMIQYTQTLQIYFINKGLLKDNYYFINGLLGYSGTTFTDIRKQIKDGMKIKDENNRFTFKIIIIGYHPDLKFSGQIKDSLTTKFKNIPITKELQNFINQIQSTKKVTLKEKYVPKCINANKLDSYPCSLILTEGDSAASLFEQIAETCKNSFHDYYGLFPLRGKVLNTYGKDDVFDINNAEIQNIISIIGFQQGVHYNQQNIQNLRYKSIIIASDYDDDGFHIKGLILNVFLQFWPELIDLNFFKQFTTPIIVADNINFYQEQEFRKQQETYKFKNVKYLKGLGSIDKRMPLFKDLCTNFQNYVKLITYTQNDYSWMYLLKALFDNKSENRKNFILNYVPQYINHSNNYIQINDILSQQVVQYSFKTLERAIPCFMDGLKDSQRKIIYHASIKNQFKEKVANFAADVSRTYDYHHGEDSLAGAIVQLAQDCVGTNNCPLLQGEGSFGSDWNPEKHAAYRYIYVSQSKWLKQLIRPEDKLLYKYRLSDDGKDIEPQQLYPIMPLFLLNGTLGVASGWSSTIPCFAFNDVRNYIISYLTEQKLPVIHPHYNNYRGRTQFIYDENNKQYMECMGVVNEDKDYIYIIETHLNKMYKAKLFDDISFNLTGASKEEKEKYEKSEHKRPIYDFKPKKLANNVICIEKKRVQQSQFTEIYKKYIYNYSKCENMTLIQYENEKITPIKFHNVYSLLNKWIDTRLYYYILRKEKLLRKYIYEYIINFNYALVNTNKLLRDHDNTQLTYQRLSYLTPFSQIEALSQQFKLESDTMEKLQQYLIMKQQQPQSQNINEYKYIMDKTVGYFVNKQYKLEEIYKKYIDLYNRTGKQIWIQELQSITVQ